MTAPAEPRTATPAELLEMGDAGRAYELINGTLEERNVSYLSSVVSARFARHIGNHAEDHDLGDVVDADLGMQVFAHVAEVHDPTRVRRADAAFIARDRAPIADSGYLHVAPDLVVEVVSPNDRAGDVRAKVDEWLMAGVRLVWVAYPSAREVYVYRANGSHSIVTEHDTLSGEDVLPGFAQPVGSFFPERPAEREG